ncbi:hypothetical protein SCHPADRAFT_242877 [Schizopora paradoxa]|uniref:Ubiquitin-like domain-containing protein n=1 Tax=Schizopora paradoxa TaxID=27342 RepID=A0A0H2RVA6_9AGAM|nr:hypothetical protein SCHPADRAFT_242877 [Schizopora paradoxa]
MRSTSLYSYGRLSTVTFVDPRGKRVEIERHLCATFESFQAYLSAYYQMNTGNPLRGSEYVQSGSYFLNFENTQMLSWIFEKRYRIGDDLTRWWNKVLDERGPLRMGVVIRRINPELSPSSGRCFRCNALITENSDAKQTECIFCDMTVWEPEHGNVTTLNEEERSTFLKGLKDERRETDFYAIVKFRNIFDNVDVPPHRLRDISITTVPSNAEFDARTKLNNFCQADPLGMMGCYIYGPYRSCDPIGDSGRWICTVHGMSILI